MIPLIAPMMPDEKSVLGWLDGIRERGIWTNFGPVSETAEAMACQYSGGFPLLCSSGMTAIQAAISTMVSWSPFRTIAISDFSHAGTLLPVIHSNFTPILVACDRRTRAMDLNVFEKLCREQTIAGAVITNPFGRGIDRKTYSAIARKHGVAIVYDYAGAWGDFAIDDEFPTVYSLHATKSLPVGEGGLAVFPRKVDEERARRYINFGTGPDRRIYQAGINGKASEITAAVLCAQLEPDQHKRIMQRLARRQSLQRTYGSKLEQTQPDGPLSMSISLCTVRLPGTDLQAFEGEAARCGFVSKQYYIPLRSMPAFSRIQQAGRMEPELDHIIALPSDVNDDVASTICDGVREIIKTLHSNGSSR